MNGKATVARPARRLAMRPMKARIGSDVPLHGLLDQTAAIGLSVRSVVLRTGFPCRSDACRAERPKNAAVRSSRSSTACPSPEAPSGYTPALQCTIDHSPPGGVTKPPNRVADPNPAPDPVDETAGAGTLDMGRRTGTAGTQVATRSPTGGGRGAEWVNGQRYARMKTRCEGEDLQFAALFTGWLAASTHRR